MTLWKFLLDANLWQGLSGLTAVILFLMPILIWLYKKVFLPIKTFFTSVSRAAKLIPTIEKEFRPNGGSSLRDSINSIQKKITFDEVKLRTVLKLDTQMLFRCDEHNNILWVNYALLNFTNRPESHFTGNNWFQILHPDERHRIMQDWADALIQKRSFHLITRILDTHNNEHWVELRTEPMLTEGGDYMGCLGVVTPTVLMQPKTDGKDGTD